MLSRGRPTYVQFMAIPSYAQLKIKMSGPNGTITVTGSVEIVHDAKVTLVEKVEIVLALIELELIRKRLDPPSSYPQIQRQDQPSI